MHYDNLHLWQHDHSFGQDKKRPGEVRTIIVIAVTATMMVFEVATGVLFGSMALLADGLHMASHAAALTISASAYARRHARDEQFSFGTGKVNALGEFTGAVLLAIFALIMVWESVERIIYPVETSSAFFSRWGGERCNSVAQLIQTYWGVNNLGRFVAWTPRAVSFDLAVEFVIA